MLRVLGLKPLAWPWRVSVRWSGSAASTREHLDLYGLIEEEGEGVGKAGGAVFENEGDE